MKVFNLTDVSTKALKSHGLFNQTFSIGGQEVPPGRSVMIDTSKASTVAKQVAHLVRLGAIAVDSVPSTYKPTFSPTPAKPAPPVMTEGPVVQQAPVPPPSPATEPVVHTATPAVVAQSVPAPVPEPSPAPVPTPAPVKTPSKAPPAKTGG